MTAPTPSQLASVGFAALAIGKAFEALEQAGFPLDSDQQARLSQAVGTWLRNQLGDAEVDAAKQALGETLGGEDADDDEIGAAITAAGSSVAIIFSTLDDAPTEAFDAASEALHHALVDAYGEESIAALQVNQPSE
ncbi:hypothetical protein R84981_002135 [Carnimonas sp. R-84981]|uniref:hypothetical protein n=1 Tax=Carnimonas bestiolae TaxID=3402172 RepID=UPI003EDBFFFE